VNWRRYAYGLLAAEIAAATRYFDEVRDSSGGVPDNPVLFELIANVPSRAPHAASERRVAHVLNGTFNYSHDIEELLRELGKSMSRHDRVVAVVYNSYLEWLYRLAAWLGVRAAPLPTTFLTLAALRNLAQLSGFELVRYRPSVYVPWSLLGLGTLINRTMTAVPLLRRLSLGGVVILRPVRAAAQPPSLSIIVPARNERGNIEAALQRLPAFGAEVEVLFVEGHSTDGTWEEIERVRTAYRGPYRVRALQQSGRGKADAVRLGFAESTGEVVTILDADLTMPPELLPRFYDAYCRGLGDFINGNRLVYPMEGGAMRFLNRVGNVFFAKLLSYVLDAPLGDSLCGTKLLARADWQRCDAWRAEFGDFDPFGDFELLFPAAILGLGITDVPIRYRDRTYGSTSISRVRHGWMLLRMTMIGFFRVKLGRT
jgi:Glycosyl transferase family 2